MVSNKVALGLFLSFSLAMGYQTIRTTNGDNVIKEPVLQRISDNNNNLANEKDLDEMIDETIQANPKFANMNFKDLKSNDMLSEENWMPTDVNDVTKVKKIQKMQKLASYISKTYDVPMKNAEKIVYATFEEAKKLLTDVVITPKDVPWLEDVRTLSLAYLAGRTQNTRMEEERIKEFLPKQPKLLEPDVALNFYLNKYQEMLKPRVTASVS